MTGQPVVVPDVLREIVWRALAGEIHRRRIVDGATNVRPDLLAFLEALRRHETAAPEPTSASGTMLSEPGIVWLTTNDVAQVLGCSDRYARTIAARIGTRTGRQWLVDRETFDRWRRPS